MLRSLKPLVFTNSLRRYIRHILVIFGTSSLYSAHRRYIRHIGNPRVVIGPRSILDRPRPSRAGPLNGGRSGRVVVSAARLSMTNPADNQNGRSQRSILEGRRIRDRLRREFRLLEGHIPYQLLRRTVRYGLRVLLRCRLTRRRTCRRVSV